MYNGDVFDEKLSEYGTQIIYPDPANLYTYSKIIKSSTNSMRVFYIIVIFIIYV